MGTVVAIGGGNVQAGETIKIDKTLKWMTQKKNPEMLFISTASTNEPSYSDSMILHFESIGFRCSHLSLVFDSYSDEEIREMILSPDVIYVGGGDTIRLYHFFKSKKLDIYLREAYDRNIVLSGCSAGAVIWFKYAFTDSLEFYTKQWNYSRFGCLGFIDAFCCPHGEGDRKEEFEKLYKSGESYPGLLLSNRTSMVWRDGVGTLVRENDECTGTVYYPTADGKYRELIPKEKEKFEI